MSGRLGNTWSRKNRNDYWKCIKRGIATETGNEKEMKYRNEKELKFWNSSISTICSRIGRSSSIETCENRKYQGM